MKIIIDISEEGYNSIISGKCEGNPLADYIEDGTPLPKGHGRLIDADALGGEWVCTHDGNYECVKSCSCEKCCDSEYQCYANINEAPTIIEADKEAEEEKVVRTCENCKHYSKEDLSERCYYCLLPNFEDRKRRNNKDLWKYPKCEAENDTLDSVNRI